MARQPREEMPDISKMEEAELVHNIIFCRQQMAYFKKLEGYYKTGLIAKAKIPSEVPAAVEELQRVTSPIKDVTKGVALQAEYVTQDRFSQEKAKELMTDNEFKSCFTTITFLQLRQVKVNVA